MRSQAVYGLALASGIATVAWRAHALSATGAVAAAVVGTAVYAGMGVRGSIAVVGYFATSSALSRLPRPGHLVQRRGNRRDAVQVLANGGPAAVFSVLHSLSPERSNKLFEAAFYGSIAAAAADTWATEIGTRWGKSPRSIVTGRSSLRGESGAVTTIGLAASLLASLSISVAAQYGQDNRRVLAVCCATGGVAGSLADSLLGAVIQEQRWCANCAVRTELDIHTCGHVTEYHSGMPAVDNDMVNLMAVIAGGFTAGAMMATFAKLTERNGSRVEFVRILTSSRLRAPIGGS